MRWTDHIANINKKLAPANGVLWKLRHALPPKAKILVYNTLFQTHLNYMSCLWGLTPWSHLKDIQVLQNRALRNVYNLPKLENRVVMYTHLVENHLPVRGLCVLNIATFMYNANHGNSHSNLTFNKTKDIYPRSLRVASNYRPADMRTNFGFKSIETIGPSC
jgi:hypothetical protein